MAGGSGSRRKYLKLAGKRSRLPELAYKILNSHGKDRNTSTRFLTTLHIGGKKQTGRKLTGKQKQEAGSGEKRSPEVEKDPEHLAAGSDGNCHRCCLAGREDDHRRRAGPRLIGAQEEWQWAVLASPVEEI